MVLPIIPLKEFVGGGTCQFDISIQRTKKAARLPLDPVRNPQSLESSASPNQVPSMSPGTIRIRGARQHNLKNLDLDIHTGGSITKYGFPAS
jgi:hypothetical protein